MKKKYLLIVQGEGRGHMTQAISMQDLLIENGHEICGVIIGACENRDIPQFFLDKIKAPVTKLPSPNFVTDKKNKSINIPRSVWHNFGKLGTFKQSLRTIDRIIKEQKPDMVINFFDLLTGLYYRFYKPDIPLLCIAHQYIYFHPDFEFPKGFAMDRMAIKFYTKLTAYGSSKNLALSFYDIENRNRNVTVVPPLLREDVFTLSPTTGGHYLIYLVNHGYFDEIAQWHKDHPDVELHCFTDQPSFIEQNFSYDRKKLIVHALNDKLFLEKMSTAKGLATTAGFESVCEAMFLGKPVLMVPVQGHFEQFCNSRDAFKARAGIYDDHFNLSNLVNYSSQYNYNNPGFKTWIANAKERIYEEIVSC